MESLDDIITNIELIEDVNLKVREIKRVLNLIDTYSMDVYQVYYLKGYLWNLLPIESVEREKKVQYYLEKSIDLKDDYIYSITELAFFYFDQKKYSNVLKLLHSVDLSFFEENGQVWKSLKLQEILLASKLYTIDTLNKDLLNEFLGLISVYSILPEEKVAVPSELVLSVIENKDKKGMYKLIQNTSVLINSENQKDYFDSEIKMKFTSLVDSLKDG